MTVPAGISRRYTRGVWMIRGHVHRVIPAATPVAFHFFQTGSIRLVLSEESP